MPRKTLASVFVFTASLALVGCAASLPTMRRLPAPRAVAAEPSSATVVFVRPSDEEGTIHHLVIDENGRFLGECRGKTHFVVKVPAGQHTFISYVAGTAFGDGAKRKEGTPALSATLEAGKVYYVEVIAVPGSHTTRARLLALGPSRDDWAKLPSWLGSTQALEPDEPAGQRYLEASVNVGEVVQKGMHSLAEYDDTARAARTLTSADGTTAAIEPR